MKNSRAFTLIELLVVVLIIGVLTAVAVPQYQKVIMKSHYSKLKNLLHSMIQAEELYYLANGNYTNDVHALDIGLPEPVSVDEKTSGNGYYYNWGYCSLNGVLSKNNTSPRVVCSLDKWGLKHAYYLPHSDYKYAGKMRCSVVDSIFPNLAHAICQEESGLSVPNDGTNTYLW